MIVFRYISFTGNGNIVAEVGFPIEKTELKSGGMLKNALPAGRYLSLIHTGAYHDLMDAHMYLESYAKANALVLDEVKTESGIHWGCRAEIYLTDPATTPVEEWKTEVLFLIK